MYLEHFGFHERPFDITVASRFFFASPMHEEAHAALLYGVRERRGFILLTGEAGTGKTTVLRRLQETLEDSIHVACFDNTTLTFDELLDVMCQLFDLPVKAGRRLEKIQALNAFLLDCHRARGTGVLIIDEAQNLADDVLENLRLLSNFEAESEKLLQIVLVGQPELEKKLDRPELRQLKQRVVVRCQLDRLKAQHIGPFIHHRLQVAGCNRQDIFAPDAIRRIAVHSGGIPRLVNTICDNALL
ncbi:MAG TPA: AAA family ATPase, partial [Methylomirabilota bacterium]|nr:AAA family ATPase [Methylomirabilota bacterium]